MNRPREEARTASAPVPGEARADAVARVLAALLVTVAAGALVEHYAGLEAAGLAAVLALLAFCVVGQRHFRLRERILIAVATLLTVAEFALEPDAAATVRRGLDQAAFLAAFMLLLAVLRDAAATSPAVEATGRFLTEQPPNRRYGAIAGGAHVLTTLLNMGALSLLAPLIKAGVRASRAAGVDPAIADVKERRQFSAAMRGFQMVIVWAPTTVTQALLASLFPGADGARVILAGLGLAALTMAMGWVEDTVRWRPLRRRLAREGRSPVRTAMAAPVRALVHFAGVCAALVALAVLVRLVFAVETVPALMLAAPVLTVAWIWWQGRSAGSRQAGVLAARRAGAIVSRGLPAASPEAMTLASAGYIGVMLAALVPPEAIALAASPEVIHPFLLLALLPLLIVVAVQFALTPIVVAVFVGTALGKVETLPVDPALLVIALSGGWALAMTASPFAAGALVLNRMTGIPATRLTWAWNGLYSVFAYGVLLAWLAVLFHLF